MASNVGVVGGIRDVVGRTGARQRPGDAAPTPGRSMDALLALLCLCASACTASATATQGPPAPCVDPAESTYAPVPEAEVTAGAPGQILRCARDGTITAADVDRIARTSTYVGDPLGSGASVLHLLYRTERGHSPEVPEVPGYSSATVLLPERPMAASLPVVVVAHGTVGEAPGCPPSQESPTGDNTYLAELGYPLVGAGYAVILTDYAGYAGFGATANPPSGYHAALDEAFSVLDAARALRAVQPTLFNDQTVLVGHSQGGHAVLSALTMHASHGSGGTLAAVVAYAPAWFPMTSFAGMLVTPIDYPTSTEYDVDAACLWYHYSHAELLDGAGSGPLLFAAARRSAIQQFFDHSCDTQGLTALGDNIGDLFDPGFVRSVAVPATIDGACSDEVCSLWKSRYAADRPHILGPATEVPLLVIQGDADEWIPPERSRCGFDRLTADGANVTFCVVPGLMHDPVVGARSTYVSRYIAWKTLGGSDPGICGGGADQLHASDGSGDPAVCASLPPND